MAQQREKEETTDLKVPETLSTCTQSIQLSPLPFPLLLLSTSDESRPMDAPDPKQLIPLDSRSCGSDSISDSDPQGPDQEKELKKRKRENIGTRCSCSGCNKKLGLMGFRCRCGEMFCPQHRYSDRHDCSFDYKAAGREAIAKDNPVVRAAKLLKV